MSLGVHTGTHMDAPIHFLRDGIGIDQMLLTAAIGRARVIEIGDPVSIKPDELASYRPSSAASVSSSKRATPPAAGRPTTSWRTSSTSRTRPRSTWRQLACNWLAWTISPSAASPWMAPSRIKRCWAAGIWIIEGLNLSQAEPGVYDLICLPLRIVGGDGAPARAILRRVGSTYPPRDSASRFAASRIGISESSCSFASSGISAPPSAPTSRMVSLHLVEVMVAVCADAQRWLSKRALSARDRFPPHSP